MKYPQAPVSEVIFGVSNANGLFEKHSLINTISLLKEDLPNYQILAPIADDIERDGEIFKELDPKKSGEILIRHRKIDDSLLVQTQKNKLYLNWIRSDEKNVGNYPGFNNIKSLFLSYALKLGISVSEHSNFELTYLDRLIIGKDIKEVDDLLNSSNFSFPFRVNDASLKNILLSTTQKLSHPNTYLISSIRTNLNIDNKKVINIENKIIGFDVDFENWIEKAHQFQIDFFENNFNKELLESWK